ncbi:MAG: hypothetical protein C0615_00040 [Desulfuromonas sp.]|nr:MAG: hypothetical protein C0615_00040 [Desulfuromonas sp.]
MAKGARNLLVVFLIVGIALIFWGVQEYGLFGNKLVRSLGGGISNKVMILWISGGALTLLGALGLFKK